LNQYRGAGRLEGWILLEIVHTALHYIKQQKRRLLEEDQLRQDLPLDEEDHPSVFESEETPKAVLHLLQQMPLGFRTVLNLYVLENYSHQQIADELGISVGTSKSQLNRAKACLRALLEKNLTR
ncbi:MAG: RNA polymerase sigma factor, partial [Saprospiraceae bacterium]